MAEEERASKLAKGRLDPGFNEQQMAVLEDTEVLVGQRDAEINNIGMVHAYLVLPSMHARELDASRASQMFGVDFLVCQYKTGRLRSIHRMSLQLLYCHVGNCC